MTLFMIKQLFSESFSRSTASTGIRRMLSILIALAVFHIVYLASPSLSAYGAEASPEQEMSGFRIKISRLQDGIREKESEVAKSERQAGNILADLEVLDKRIAAQKEKLENLEEKLKTQEDLINKDEIALQRLHKEKNSVQEHLRNRITSYYTMGDIGLLNVTFSTKTLPELLTFHDAFDSLIKYDQEVINIYRKTINELEKTKNALALEQTVLQTFVDQNREEKQALEQIREEKRGLLTRVRTQTELHKKAITEMQDASENLAKSIVAIKSKNTIDEQRFQADKGNLPPPVDGVLVTLFQQEKENKLGVMHKSMGIELQAPDGVKIIAVSDGEVIYAGYLRGYGNTVIINHGLQFYTVTSRIEKILVKKGQQVKAEEKIGIMGSTATLFDEGLYFEIRHGRQSLDPLLWLNPNRLSVPHELLSDSEKTEQ